MKLRHLSSLFLLLMLTTFLRLNGQVIVCDPPFPTDQHSVRIVFNAAEGSGGLKGYTDPIWAHTGVITTQSTSGTDWRYVIAGWSTNTEKARLTPLGNDLWEFKIGPDIRSFYNVPASVGILKIAFVFRNADGSRTGKNQDGSDIFQLLYESGLNLILREPISSFLVVDPGVEIPVEAVSSGSDSIVLARDGIRLTGTESNELIYNIIAEDSGLHDVMLTAWAEGESVRDSFQYFVRSGDFYRELPDGVVDGINYPDDQSAILVLFAPGKEHVFLIGDFNDWQVDPDYLMYKTPNNERFWIEIENLEPRKEYIFQYLVDGELRIADPYTTKTSDPWSDSQISSTVYPDLISYPMGKTTEIASVLQTAKPVYQWQVNDFQKPDQSNLVIYELLVRDFTQCHTFACMLDTLDYLERLGINAIELMPVSEFENNDSWGYNPSFYFAPDKYYGPADDLKAFIDACHARGIAVILDMVLNHSYGQSPLVRLYWDSENERPSVDNPWYNVQSPNSVFSWGYDFNHESIHTERFVDRVNAYWLEEFRFDGFRFDFTKGFTNTPGDGGAYDASRIQILKRMYDQIREVSGDAYVILEHFADNREERELSSYGMLIWGNVNYNYRKASSSFFLEGKSDFSSISWMKRGWTVPHLVGYMESHDEERLMYECYYWGNTTNPEYRVKDTTVALSRMELAANFFIPIPGPKMIWMFGELGYDYSINYNGRVGRKPIRWDYQSDWRRERVYEVYAVLNQLKQEHLVFTTADYALNFSDTVKRISLNHSTMNVAILGNFGTYPSMGDPEFQHTGWWYELWTGDSLEVIDTHSKVVLMPGEYRFYTDIRLDRPDIISGIGSQVLRNRTSKVEIYPNPASGKVMVRTSVTGGLVRYRLLDLQGRQVGGGDVMLDTVQGLFEVDLSGLQPGIYLIEVAGARSGGVGKVMVR